SAIVHPEIGTPAELEQFSSYFEGNNTPPQLYNEVLPNEKINQLYEQGLPGPDLPSPIEVKTNNDGKLRSLIWENGTYTIKGKNGVKSLGQIKDCAVTNIAGQWKVQFPKGSKAPSEITLPVLMSLYKHEDFNVRHFSGTAT